MNTPPDAELRERIKDIIAPNHHIDHRNVRPTSVSFTSVGVEHVADQILQLITADRSRLVREIKSKLPSSKIDLVKLERDKTGWIEEMGVDSETLTDKDMIAIWQLARHFKGQALSEVATLLEGYEA